MAMDNAPLKDVLIKNLHLYKVVPQFVTAKLVTSTPISLWHMVDLYYSNDFSEPTFTSLGGHHLIGDKPEKLLQKWQDSTEATTTLALRNGGTSFGSAMLGDRKTTMTVASTWLKTTWWDLMGYTLYIPYITRKYAMFSPSTIKTIIRLWGPQKWTGNCDQRLSENRVPIFLMI